ncbi:MAG: IS1634 family transposase [Alphaproteobacteria bacterium]|nr:IS1634 family transposase [Alphaproteobacteria bacterium]
MKETILETAKTLTDGQIVTLDQAHGPVLILTFSKQRAKKDRHNRDKGIDKLRKQVAKGKLQKQHINNRGYNKFLSMQGNIEVTLDEEKIIQESKWDGLKGYITNSTLPAQDLVEHYKELWNIERAFRISKTDLRIRPIFHRKKERIEAHLCIAFAAYAVYKELERKLKINKTGMSAAQAIELSKTIFHASFKLPESGKEITIFNNLSGDQKKLIDL